jgi:serine/threonine protein phosphatase PrpC
MNFSIHQASHIGNRKYNQDRAAYAYGKDALLLVLADGMGGHLHGELAAAIAIETFVESFSGHHVDPSAFLSDTMREAHRRIMDLPQKSDHAFPGTTCVAALIQDDTLYYGHAGDSRLYLMRNGDILAKTVDHSIVQLWLQAGILDEEAARNHPRRNQITNCLGGVEDLFEIELGKPMPLQPKDVLLLCSDGLCGPVRDMELVGAFDRAPVGVALDALIERALMLAAGHADNVTGLALRWGGDEPGHEADPVVRHVLEI